MPNTTRIGMSSHVSRCGMAAIEPAPRRDRRGGRTYISELLEKYGGDVLSR
jgi:hypothetical protein